MTSTKRTAAVSTTFCLVTLALSLATGSASAQPRITRPVTDLAHALTEGEAQTLTNRLIQHRSSTGVQVAVLIVRSTGGRSIEDFSLRVATTWRGGQVGADDGVLYTLALAQHEHRIEAGRGLAAVFPPERSREILDRARTFLRQNDRYLAVSSVLDEIFHATGAPSAPSWPSDWPATPQPSFELATQPAPLPLPTPPMPVVTAPQLDEDGSSNNTGFWIAGTMLLAFVGVLIAMARQLARHGAASFESPSPRWPHSRATRDNSHAHHHSEPQVFAHGHAHVLLAHADAHGAPHIESHHDASESSFTTPSTIDTPSYDNSASSWSSSASDASASSWSSSDSSASASSSSSSDTTSSSSSSSDTSWSGGGGSFGGDGGSSSW